MCPSKHLRFARIVVGWAVAILFLGFAGTRGGAETRQYAYDDLRRLISVTYGDGTVVTFTYDNAGNRLMERVALASAPADMAPSAPNSPSIANGATGVSTTASLSWQVPSDPDTGDAVASYVYFGTSDHPPLVASGWLANWSPGHLNGFTTYYWYVVARDSRGLQSSSPVWSFTTGNDPPEPDFLATPTSGWAPLAVTFSDRSISRDDAIVSWAWDFNGDGIVDSTEQNPRWTYTLAGNSPVKLTVTDAHGGSVSITKPSFIRVLDKSVLDLAPVSLELNGTAPYRHVGVIYSVTNLGTQSVTVPCEWDDLFYVSTNTVLDGWARQVGYFHESATLLPGSYYRRTNILALPDGIDSHYNLFLQTDGNKRIPEINENNNVTVVPLNLPAPNLVPETLVFPQLLSGEKQKLAWKIANRGTAKALGSWYDEVYISTNSVFDWKAESLGSVYYDTNLSAGADYWVTNEVQLPRLSAGTYHLFLKTDDSDAVFETEEGDNTIGAVAPVVLGPRPDLAPLAVLAPTPLLSGQSVRVSWAVTNQGAASAMGRWSDYVCLSTQAVWQAYDSSRQYLGYFDHEVQVASGASYWTTNEVYLPRISPGAYYLWLYTDAEDDLFESNETNNVLAAAVKVELGAQPDLLPVRVSVPSPLPSGQTVEIVTTITNQGIGLAQGSRVEALFLSTNAVFNGSGFLDYNFQESSLAARNSIQETNLVHLPRLDPGNYYLYAVADYMDQVFESNETNNILRIPLPVVLAPQPDLVPVKLIAPPSLSPGQFADLVWAVTNQGPGVCQAPWFDIVYLSTNSSWDPAAMQVSFYQQEANVAARSVYFVTNAIMTPNALKTGTYYLFLMTDAMDQVYELAEDNNILSAPIVIAGVANGPDLVPVRFDVPSWVQSGAAVPVSYAVKNAGSTAAEGAWMDMLWFSSTPVFDETAVSVGYQYLMTPLPAGGTYSQTATLNLPAIAEGPSYLFLQVNAFNLLAEANPDNNLISAPIQVGGQPPANLRFTGCAYLPNGDFKMAVEGTVGSRYTLLGSNDLLNWQPVLSFDCTTNPTWITAPGDNASTRRYYRVTAPAGAATAK